jgi:hypothetical protein
MIWLPRSVVLAGLLLAFGLPCRAADNGPAHFDPNALLGYDGVGGSLPVSTGPNGGAPPPESGGGATLPISTGPNGGAPPPESTGGSTLPVSTGPNGGAPPPSGPPPSPPAG